MKRIAAVAVIAAFLFLAAGCSKNEYNPKMKDPKQQEKDGREMWQHEEKK